MTHRSASLNELEWVRLDFTDIFGGAHALHLPASRFDDVLKRGTPVRRFRDGRPRPEPRGRHAARPRRVDADLDKRWSRACSCAPRAPSVARGGSAIRGWRCKACSSASTDSRRRPSRPELEFYLLDQGGRPIDDAGYYDGEENVGIKATRAAAAELLATESPSQLPRRGRSGPVRARSRAADSFGRGRRLLLAKLVIQQCAASIGAHASFHAATARWRARVGATRASAVRSPARRIGIVDERGRRVCGRPVAPCARVERALAAPAVNSYKRLHSGPEAPTAAMWARLNRGALIRVSSFREGEASIEYRGADPSANPYLLFGSLLAAGADGIAQESQLPPPSDEDVFGGYDPAAATVRFDSLPPDLDDAWNAPVRRRSARRVRRPARRSSCRRSPCRGGRVPKSGHPLGARNLSARTPVLGRR